MRKQSITNEQFAALRESAKQISGAQLEEKVAIAAARLKGVEAFGWSGGKDSIALEFICRQAGVTPCLLGRCNLEYPAFERWLEANPPAGLEVINAGQDLEWLAQNPAMLFPDGPHASRWFSIVQHRAQRQFCKQHGVKVLALGRRREDGNYTGSGGKYTANGIDYVLPIFDWTHEEVFALVDQFGLPMPPIYDWPNGYKCGTHPWPARQWCESEEDGWRQIGAIDKSILKQAAGTFPLAKKALKEV